MSNIFYRSLIALAAVLLFSTNAEARTRHYGKCDGFQRCRCGVTAARYHGLPLNYKGYNLKMASEYRRAFPRTSFRVGVIGVKPHHALTVVGGGTCAKATVYDDAGTYVRNVCNMVFVDPNGNGVTWRKHATQEAPTLTIY